MMTHNIFYEFIFLCLCLSLSLYGTDIREQFTRSGCIEICDRKGDKARFDHLYELFDECVTFFQKNPSCAQKLYSIKERFIRTNDRSYYSTDFFGLFDESQREGRSQVSFYYSIHFHRFMCAYNPELNTIPEIQRFFEVCLEMCESYADIFNEVTHALGLKTLFDSEYGRPPILLKIIKYLPAYRAMRPHYDGTAFSLFLDSTNNQSLLFAPYKASFTQDDFYSPAIDCARWFKRDSMILIPGILLQEFAIYPTPHVVMGTGNVRYAAIAFAMRPHYNFYKNSYTCLPYFKD